MRKMNICTELVKLGVMKRKTPATRTKVPKAYPLKGDRTPGGFELFYG